ncbi:DNA cytosine methyltransferase [Neobacillus niacini]|uniref:DNA cytosine methyltransferase n=1 Tax=Neobacillus niacini TaxID=86668 RepID=UPI002FFE4419
MQLDLFREIIVDNFAGGGGASTGIEMATGLSVDIAINHDPAAIAMHKVNHPDTEHYCESVWDVDPVKAVKGRKVGLAWFSPDCKHFSKAKGGKPVEKKIRGLAWIVLKWAALVRPRVIMLENVEEFQTWGPIKRSRPIKSRKGETYLKWRKQLEDLGYEVETNELVACDYGAPTKRKRFFMIARCDGQPIEWPKKTHGPKDSFEVKKNLLKPYLTAAQIIDWDIPSKSIFGREKPLAENTLKRIARGLQKFVIENPEPFVLKKKNTASYMIQYHSETTKSGVRGQTLDQPILTIDSSPRYGLVTAFISKNYAGQSRSVASDLNDCLHTITARQCHALVEISLSKQLHSAEVDEYMQKYYGKTVFGDKQSDSSFLIKYYGQGTGQPIDQPLDTVTSRDTFGLVTIKGIDYKIIDIGLRMLEPHELFAAQGFPSSYIIDRDCNGKLYSKSKQVARCGNAVPPPFSEALVRANLPEYCVKTNRYKQAII